MKLKTFLELHQKFTTQDSLPDNIGDGYLLRHNLIYKNVRLATKEAGIGYTSGRFHDYDVLPLTQLPKILQEQKVPYFPNVHALQEIENKVPGFFNLNDSPPLRANYAHHESAHCLARLIRMEFIGEARATHGKVGASLAEKSLDDQRELALIVLFEEAFANAADSLLSAYSDEVQDHFLLRNTYIFEPPSTRKTMKAVIKNVGLASTFKMMLFSFLFANFQRNKASASELKRVMKIVFQGQPDRFSKLGDREFQQLRNVFDAGFELDPEFTTRTNEFCLRLLGVTASPKNLYSFDFLKVFETNPKYQRCLERMGQVIETGCMT